MISPNLINSFWEIIKMVQGLGGNFAETSRWEKFSELIDSLICLTRCNYTCYSDVAFS